MTTYRPHTIPTHRAYSSSSKSESYHEDSDQLRGVWTEPSPDAVDHISIPEGHHPVVYAHLHNGFPFIPEIQHHGSPYSVARYWAVDDYMPCRSVIYESHIHPAPSFLPHHPGEHVVRWQAVDYLAIGSEPDQ